MQRKLLSRKHLPERCQTPGDLPCELRHPSASRKREAFRRRRIRRGSCRDNPRSQWVSQNSLSSSEWWSCSGESRNERPKEERRTNPFFWRSLASTVFEAPARRQLSKNVIVLIGHDSPSPRASKKGGRSASARVSRSPPPKRFSPPSPLFSLASTSSLLASSLGFQFPRFSETRTDLSPLSSSFPSASTGLNSFPPLTTRASKPTTKKPLPRPEIPPSWE